MSEEEKKQDSTPKLEEKEEKEINTDLAFQEFAENQPEEEIGGDDIVIQIDQAEGGPPVEEGEITEPKPGNAKFWTIDFYKPFFEIDDVEILKKILSFYTLKLFKKKSDLYVPFWAITSLIVVLCVSNNLGGLIYHHQLLSEIINPLNETVNPFKPEDIQEWGNDFTIFSLGGLITYLYWIIVSIILWAFYKWTKVNITIYQTISVNAYSLITTLPLLLMAIINWEIAKWLLIMFGFLTCSIFVVLNTWTKWKGVNWGIIVGAISFIVLSFLVFGVFVKLFFFWWNEYSFIKY